MAWEYTLINQSRRVSAVNVSKAIASYNHSERLTQL